MTRFAGAAALLVSICFLPARGAGPASEAALKNAALAWTAVTTSRR